MRVDRLIRHLKEWDNKPPEVAKAHNTVNNAIRDGRLKRGKCIKCGKPGQAHHKDYSKPYDITWLCDKHHKEVEGKKKAS